MTPERFQRACTLLELSAADFDVIRCEPNIEVARRKMGELRAHARRALKRRALELHPDRTGGDVEKADTLKLLTEALRFIDTLQVVPKPPPPPPTQYVVVVMHGSASSNTRTSNARVVYQTTTNR